MGSGRRRRGWLLRRSEALSSSHPEFASTISYSISFPLSIVWSSFFCNVCIAWLLSAGSGLPKRDSVHSSALAVSQRTRAGGLTHVLATRLSPPPLLSPPCSHHSPICISLTTPAFMPSRTLPTTAPLSTEVTGPPLTLDLTPDSLGPFTLGGLHRLQASLPPSSE